MTSLVSIYNNFGVADGLIEDSYFSSFFFINSLFEFEYVGADSNFAIRRVNVTGFNDLDHHRSYFANYFPGYRGAFLDVYLAGVGSSALIEDSYFYSNFAFENGLLFYTYYLDNLTFINTTFQDNSNINFMMTVLSEVNITSCLFQNNTSKEP